SHHGQLYNWLFFNDGYHAEHHARPGRHWTRLRQLPCPTAVSRWPPILQWLEFVSLDGLEELVCRHAGLQRFVLRAHERAFSRLLSCAPAPRRIVIVGGGLFPRSAIVLRGLFPKATLVLVDQRADRLERARAFLQEHVEFIVGFCAPSNWESIAGPAELLIVPLALQGSKEGFYRGAPRTSVLIHDWLWRRHNPSAIVSLLLLKRLNLVCP